jgi:ATP-dependent DNA helicase RecG
MTNNENLIKDIISQLERSLVTGDFKDVEHSYLELKDLSTGNEWKSLYQTVCAFLNTKGGYIVCGIRERNRSYNLSGFDRNNEGRLLELRNKFFRNERNVLVDLADYIDFEYVSLLERTLAVLTVRALSEDLKFVQVDDVFYERVLTQDKVISKARQDQQREYKLELEYSKELSTVSHAVLTDIDLDKVNQFILRINATGRRETIKKDYSDASDFLNRRYCIGAESSVTVLGLLLFGKDPYRFLEYRAEVDCYYDTRNEIGVDKRIFQNDIFNLMDDSFSFVWGHIQVGRSVSGGGVSKPEFPEKLVREVINNAFAHRDYISNHFITVKINPGENIEIKNPGSFKQKMLVVHSDSAMEVRRIVPGVPETKNPKLANVLKAFDKIESQGIGMATLVSSCLDNQIDVPYFDLSIPETISLIVPSGKLIGEEEKRWISSFRSFIRSKLEKDPTPEHELVLTYLYKSEKLNKNRFYTILLSPSNNHFDVLAELKYSGLIFEYTETSNLHAPVFFVHRELVKVDYTKEIELFTGKSLEALSVNHKSILNIIFRHSHFNNQSLKPSEITPELYQKLHGKKIDPTTYESLGRKVRKVCNELLHAGFITKSGKNGYELKSHSVTNQLDLPF